MKKLLFLLALASCEMAGPDSPKETGQSGETSFSYYENSKINASEEFPSGLGANYDILSGSKRVFEYIFVKKDDPGIADDEFTETLVFELPKTAEKASFRDGEIMDLNPVYSYLCYCVPAKGLKEIKGTLEVVKKSGGKFQVKADLEVFFLAPEGFQQETFSRKVNFDGVFVKK